MNRQEKNAVSQEERKEKIRARYKGVDRSELEFIPANKKKNYLKMQALKGCVHIVVCPQMMLTRLLLMSYRKTIMKI